MLLLGLVLFLGLFFLDDADLRNPGGFFRRQVLLVAIRAHGCAVDGAIKRALEITQNECGVGIGGDGDCHAVERLGNRAVERAGFADGIGYGFEKVQTRRLSWHWSVVLMAVWVCGCARASGVALNIRPAPFGPGEMGAGWVNGDR